eukprot:767779-Hanusia_phi.AAC.2
MHLQNLRVGVHPLLMDGEQPLDVAMVGLEKPHIVLPLVQDDFDQGAMGGGGDLVAVEAEVQ